ncbi:ribose utilization transcriptional repressor RbsR [Enterococcus pallens]|uniref:LacI family transcriptional regulator n=1 Tax=Enterococcus pallens ATCC BAA-351 TaxID=1158607 RepID=R2Q9D2_9ENTE|nr:substrate-binding domain-containing protein [Enterococcus pallens]EOH91848.1 LacI family transcriptional regulator [Enterococcus pallens ATCC BAA-351]EOU25276.1 LacI family transcriptional regulator [Enterococcus pallens ATCC BAA-351]OJG79922.1 LacI family transcriptional regulator [Enterococcus pallens]
MANKKITIKDVAKRAGVSIATVSQILNGNAEKFTRKTIDKVMEAKIELNYEPDYFARRMIVKKSKTIGVLVPDITNPFFGQLLRGVEKVLYRENFVAMFCNADLDEHKERDYLEELSRRGVDGFIIASSAISNQVIMETLRKKDLPFIVLDQKKADGFSDAVLTDDFLGGRLAAQHLAELGHQKVAVVMPKEAPDNIQKRLAGFREIFPAAKVINSQLSKLGGRAAAAQISVEDVTGIFAINDEIAFGLYLGLNEAGKQIPEDYSIVGYDNIDMCEYVTPQLTSIAQPVFELGQTTAELLLERIAQPEKEWEEKMLPVHLVKRQSTKNMKQHT